MQELKRYKCGICGNIEETAEDCLECENKHPKSMRVQELTFEKRAAVPVTAILTDNEGNEYKYKLVCLHKSAVVKILEEAGENK